MSKRTPLNTTLPISIMERDYARMAGDKEGESASIPCSCTHCRTYDLALVPIDSELES